MTDDDKELPLWLQPFFLLWLLMKLPFALLWCAFFHPRQFSSGGREICPVCGTCKRGY